MVHVAGTVRPPLYSSSSLDPSETNQKTLELRGASTATSNRTVDGNKKAPRYTYNDAQAGLHRRHQRDREIIIDALDSSTFGPIGKQRIRMANCGLSPLFVLKADFTVGLAPGFCRCRLCPTCQARRGRDLSTRVHAIVRTMDAPRFVTLTLRSTNESLKHTCDRLYQAFRDLRRSKLWSAHVRGGVAVAEITWNQQTGLWHPHLHVITDGTYLPQSALSAEWARVTSGSTIVDIRAVHDRRTAAKYVCEYVAKPSALTGWPPAQINEFAYALHGRRLVVTFGTCHRVRIPEDECETRVAIVEPLASAPAVLRALGRGCLCAAMVVEFLGRVGGVAASAVGRWRPPSQPAPIPLEHWEWDQLADGLRFIATDDTGSDSDACPFPIGAGPTPVRGPMNTPERVDDFSAPFRT